MNRILIALPLFAFAAVSPAQEAAPASEPAKPAEQATATTPKPVERYNLKTKSTFSIADGTRAPFNPIGWVKRVGVANPVVQQVNIDASGFRLTSILIGNPSLAVINGRSYEEGQFLRMPRGGPQVRIRLYRIGDGQVWLQTDDKLLTVPLKRPELNEKRVDEQLLSEDRDILPDPAKPPAEIPPQAASITR